MTSEISSKKLVNFLKDFLIGGISAIISKTSVAPVERVKLLLQTQDYTGIINCFKVVSKNEGLFALWRGNGANIIRYFPTQALNFAFKDTLKIYLCPYNHKTEPMKFLFGSILAGGTAGSLTQCFIQPLDFARTRVATDIGKTKSERQFSGLFDCLRKIYKTDGVRGVYQGLQVSLITLFVYRGCYFGFFDVYKKFVNVQKISENALFRVIFNFINAQIITTVAGLIVYPQQKFRLDTIRQRLMMNSGLKILIYKGNIDCVRTIYNTENGIKAFYKGSLSNIFRGIGQFINCAINQYYQCIIGASLALVAYDEIQNLSLKIQKF